MLAKEGFKNERDRERPKLLGARGEVGAAGPCCALEVMTYNHPGCFMTRLLKGDIH
jgi:hypothetical protein